MTQQQGTNGEKLIGIIPCVSRRKGLLGTEGFNIVVTDKRMIFAIMTSGMVQEEAKKEGKGGFLSGMVGAATAGYTLHKRYLTMPPEAALKENAQNFSVELGSVKKAKVEEGRAKRGTGIAAYEESHVEIATSSDKWKFTIPHQFVVAAQETVRKAGLPK